MLDEEVNHRKSAAAVPPWAELLASEELLQMAIRDPLTGLLNRRAFDEALRWFWRQGREQPLPVGLLILDIDHFKAINDTHGHPAGDDVLVQVAATLRATSAGHGLLARHGGEEFAWLLPEVDLAQATLQCEYAREAVAFASQALPVTISIGVSAHRPWDTVGEWLQRADAALYAAKRGGRDRVQAA